jgi:hypothetical protein
LRFFTKAFADTKRQVARRIYDFIRNKTLERMFSSPINKLDMFDAMNAGAIILVNTSKALLKSSASALFDGELSRLPPRVLHRLVWVRSQILSSPLATKHRDKRFCPMLRDTHAEVGSL